MAYTARERSNGKRGVCPKCNSRELDFLDEVHEADTFIYQKVSCGECGHEFTQIYKLIDVEE